MPKYYNFKVYGYYLYLHRIVSSKLCMYMQATAK